MRVRCRVGSQRLAFLCVSVAWQFSCARQKNAMVSRAGGDVLSPEAAFIHLKDLTLVRQYLQDVRCPGGSTSPLAVAKSIERTGHRVSLVQLQIGNCGMALSQWICTAENLGHASWVTQ
jgi:hypothetical protein